MRAWSQSAGPGSLSQSRRASPSLASFLVCRTPGALSDSVSARVICQVGAGAGVRRGAPPPQRAPPGSAPCLHCRKVRHGVLRSERKTQSERDCEPNRESQAEIGSAGTEAKTAGRDLCSQQSNDRTGAAAI